jgi:hypothetical protein
MGSRLIDIAEARASTREPFERIGQSEARGVWHSNSWRKCKGPCCTCALDVAEEKYRESTRALGRANGLAKGIRPGEYFEDAEVKFAMGLNDNNLFSLFAGDLLRMYLDPSALARYCSDSRVLIACEMNLNKHEVMSTAFDCDCSTCRKLKILGGRKSVKAMERG